MKLRLSRPLLTVALLVTWLTVTVRAQEPQMTLKLRRYFGYGGFGGELQGIFRLSVSGPAGLERVVFYLDGQPIGEVNQAPFELQDSTDNFPPGRHTLLAVGYTSAGLELRSNDVYSLFLTAEEAGRATRNLIAGLLGSIVVLGALAFLVSSLLSRGKGQPITPGRPRHYGLAGGAVCPQCGRPFGRHWWSPNLVLGKLERCPFCGKVAVVRAASQDELAAAEARELEQVAPSQATPALSKEEQLRRELEDSRFHDA